jgi:hypothetical protein
MAVKNRTDLTNTLVANITDELNRQNTAARVREIIQDIIDSALNSLDDAASPTTIYSTTINIPSADVLTLNSSRITVLSGLGVGKAYVCLPSTTITSVFSTTPYATNTTCRLISDGATDAQIQFLTVLNNTLTRTTTGSQQQATSAADTQIIEGGDVYFEVITGDPTAGDGDLILNLQYIIIDL